MFDLPEDVREIQTEHLTNLMQNLNVYINIRQKPKLCALSVIIKGIERNASKLLIYSRFDQRHASSIICMNHIFLHHFDNFQMTSTKPGATS